MLLADAGSTTVQVLLVTVGAACVLSSLVGPIKLTMVSLPSTKGFIRGALFVVGLGFLGFSLPSVDQSFGVGFMNVLLRPQQKVVVTNQASPDSHATAQSIGSGDSTDDTVSERVAVEKFYNFQNDKRWRDAYALLSASLRDTSTFSFSQFIADRRDTTSIYATDLRVEGNRVYATVHWEKPGSVLNLNGYWVVQKENDAWKLDDYKFSQN